MKALAIIMDDYEINKILQYMEVESEITRMITKVHESMQPFYRTMFKIELTKKKSDKKHGKYDRILSVAK